MSNKRISGKGRRISAGIPPHKSLPEVPVSVGIMAHNSPPEIPVSVGIMAHNSLPEVPVSVGIMAHNEERNIALLLEALLRQRTSVARIAEIVVVSSGSTDATNEIVSRYASMYSQIRLVLEEKRFGKAAAINHFIKIASEEVLVLESADTLPAEDAIEALVAPFVDKTIGMAGGRPTPTNRSDTLMGFGSRFIWNTHHERNVAHPTRPKMGELVAFRKLFTGICKTSAVDEAEIECIVSRLGLKRRYCEDAVVYNHGPATLREFVLQRRRVHAGNFDLKKRTGYYPVYGNVFELLRWALRYSKVSPRKFSWLCVVAGAEAWSIVRARVSYQIKKIPPYKWPMIDSGRAPRLSVFTPSLEKFSLENHCAKESHQGSVRS